MWLKIVFLALCCAVLVKSIPVNPPKDERKFLFLNNPALNTDDEPAFLWQSQNVNAEQLLADEDITYRLPNNSLPIKYDLWIKTDVDKEDFNFQGRVKIHLRIVEATDVITLHYRQIEIDNVDLLSVTEEAIIENNLDFAHDEVYEFLKITLPSQQQPDDELILDISYHGILREDGTGFYRASYTTKDGVQVWFATTQFEMTDARHAMPCYDEPGIRAVTSLKIEHGKAFNAISNMPIISEIDIAGTDLVTTTFDDTVPMQSYLLAFIISDYDYASNDDRIVEQRVYARPEAVEGGEVDFAVSAVGPILEKMQEHFGVDFPLPKMDHALIADYIWGAMENFGLITYQERSMLYLEGRDAVGRQTSIIELISHEYAHQWFGDIVSPQWWAFAWLNEGFATLYANYIPSLLYPDDGWMDRFRNNAQNAAFNVDILNSVPLNYYVETPDTIRGKFNTISYQKGGSVLRMFQEALTIPAFTKGLNYYLTEMYFKSATPSDLHRNLQKAYDEYFPGNTVDIDRFMSTWEVQAGYPVINVERSGSGFTFTQTRFGGGSEIYTVPISYATKSDPNFYDRTPKLWMSDATTSVPHDNADDWIIINLHRTGYFKVSYDASIWPSFIAALQEDHETIAAYHRGQLFVDADTLVRGEVLTPTHGLEMLSYLDKENDFTVWRDKSALESFFSDELFGDSVLSDYFDFLQSLTKPHLDRLGFASVEGESAADASLRTYVSQLSCKALNEECLTFELNRLKAYIAAGTGSYSLCSGLRLAEQSVHTFVFDEMLRASGNSRTTYINALGCSLDEDVLKTYLSLVLDAESTLTNANLISILQSTLPLSMVSFNAVLDFIHENYAAINVV